MTPKEIEARLIEALDRVATEDVEQRIADEVKEAYDIASMNDSETSRLLFAASQAARMAYRSSLTAMTQALSQVLADIINAKE